MDNAKRNVISLDIQRDRYYLGDSDKFIEIDSADMNFPTRMAEAARNIETYFEEIRKKYNLKDTDDLNDIKTGKIEEDLSIFSDSDKFIKEKLNYVFDYDVSSVIFGNASCLTVTAKGEYYFENFLNAIMPIIEKTFDVRLKKLNMRVKSYTNRKGSHPAYRK